MGLKRQGGMLVAAYVALLLVSSLLIGMVEPEGSALTHFDQALWWSIVTSTTVGYGDIYPASGAGKIVAVLLPMFMGIGIGAAFITHVASVLIERRDKRMHGERQYKGRDHIVIVGSADETPQLIEQIRNDESYADMDIVLVADIQRHPLPDEDRLFFVKGRPDTQETLKKANIGKAGQIVIHTGNDEESLFALINVLRLTDDKSEITVRCLSTDALETFNSIPGEFQVIMQMTAEMMVQAMQDKVHIPLQILLKNDEQEEIYHLIVPQNTGKQTWWDLHTYFKQTYNYLTFALQKKDKSVIINPESAQVVEAGDGLWLIAPKRPLQVDWPS